MKLLNKLSLMFVFSLILLSNVAVAITPSIAILAEEDANKAQVYSELANVSASVAQSTETTTPDNNQQEVKPSFYSNTKKKDSWVRGNEYGIENQVETDEGEKFVQRTFLRFQKTFDKDVYESANGNSFHVEAKGGPMIGYYIGSRYYAPDDGYGSLKQVNSGLTGEVVGTYNINTNKTIKPFVGVSADAELMFNPRIEWQTDAVVGAKFNVAKDKDVALRYQHTLLHRFHYLTGENRTYHQNDGYAVGLVGTKYNKNGTSQSIRLEYERFEQGENTTLNDGIYSYGYEPLTENWLVSYKVTF